MSKLALCTLLGSGLGFASAFSPSSVCAGPQIVTPSAEALAEVQACSCEIAYTEHSLKEKVCELGYACCGDSYEVDVSYSTAIEVVAIEKSIDLEYVPKPVKDAAAASGASGCQSYQYELKNEKYEFDGCDGGIDYEVDANDLSVVLGVNGFGRIGRQVVRVEYDTHPGADDAPPLERDPATLQVFHESDFGPFVRHNVRSDEFIQSGDFFGVMRLDGLDPMLSSNLATTPSDSGSDGPWRWVTQGNNIIRGYIQKYNDPPVPARFGRA